MPVVDARGSPRPVGGREQHAVDRRRLVGRACGRSASSQLGRCDHEQEHTPARAGSPSSHALDRAGLCIHPQFCSHARRPTEATSTTPMTKIALVTGARLRHWPRHRSSARRPRLRRDHARTTATPPALTTVARLDVDGGTRRTAPRRSRDTPLRAFASASAEPLAARRRSTTSSTTPASAARRRSRTPPRSASSASTACCSRARSSSPRRCCRCSPTAARSSTSAAARRAGAPTRRLRGLRGDEGRHGDAHAATWRRSSAARHPRERGLARPDAHGPRRTAGSRRSRSSSRRSWPRRPSDRLGESDDVGKAIAALLSDDLAWITGEVIEVSGGYKL